MAAESPLGKPARRAGGLDAPVRRALREVELRGAVGIDRRVAKSKVEPSALELGEAGHEIGHACAFALREPGNIGDQLIIGNVRQSGNLHAPLSHALFRRSGNASTARS
jgi:hypothetical protein